MVEAWFVIVALLVTAYSILDGFDLGAGALHCFVARHDAERRQVLAAIGPFWDGNEVFLIATGGALFLAFPRVLASLLSGLYLAVFLFLWLLILRGVAIEFRSHVKEPLWRAFFDFVFNVASGGLALLLGVAAGNVVRGVPLDATGHFSLPLFVGFSPFGELGILDWYTIPCGLFSMIALAHHGAAFLAWKTNGQVQTDSLRAQRLTFFVLLPGWALVTIATLVVRADLIPIFFERPLAWVGVVLSIGGIVFSRRSLAQDRHGASFLGSVAFLAGLSLATAALSYPILLYTPAQPSASLAADTMSSGSDGLSAGLRWWWLAATMCIVYFVVIFRIHRGKVSAER